MARAGRSGWGARGGIGRAPRSEERVRGRAVLRWTREWKHQSPYAKQLATVLHTQCRHHVAASAGIRRCRWHLDARCCSARLESCAFHVAGPPWDARPPSDRTGDVDPAIPRSTPGWSRSSRHRMVNGESGAQPRISEETTMLQTSVFDSAAPRGLHAPARLLTPRTHATSSARSDAGRSRTAVRLWIIQGVPAALGLAIIMIGAT